MLDDVCFELRAGETHVLSGENGAGKSTLMRILSGVYADYEGEIRIRGEARRFRTPQEAARGGISIIHQELSLIPDMSVSDNIFLGRERRGGWGRLRLREERRACRDLLTRLGVDARPEAAVSDYPISVRQNIEIAKALAFDAAIIVMDEPTSALTAPEVERLFAVMDALKQQGRGIVYISHKMEEIYRVADRISVLRDGRYIGTAPAAQLPKSELIRWMVGREIDQQCRHETAQAGAPAIEVRNFTVPDPGGRPRPAVHGASFTIHAGEILGIAGLQGSGAEELFNGLFGAYGRRARGDILLNGQPYIPHSPRRALRRGLALLSSDRKREGLIQNMSIAHNMTLAALSRHSPGGLLRETREREAARQLQETFGIRAENVDQEVSALSGGNQQKVVLAKCMETRPRTLLLNEPTRGVDIGAKQDIYSLMHRWTRSGVAVALISTEMPELLGLSDRIMVLHQGEVAAIVTREQATPEGILAAAMGRIDKDRS